MYLIRSLKSSHFHGCRIPSPSQRHAFIQMYSVGQNDCAKLDGSADNCFNQVGIQLLPEFIRSKIFGDCNNQRLSEQAKVEIEKHLSKHNLLGQKTTVKNVNMFQLPPVYGQNIDEHFRIIATQQSEPYRKSANFMMSSDLPSRPKHWVFHAGWTKYDVANKTCYAVDFPDEDVIVFDVEVLVSEGDYPTLATAVSPTAWYSWCSDRIFDKHVKDKQHVCNNDLIPFETVHSRKPRLIIGHNVGFDRSFIQQQYLIQNTKTRFLDTMSLHIAVAGLTAFQRLLYMAKKTGSKRKEVLEHEDEAVKHGSWPSFNWTEQSSLNNLNDVHQLYCNDAIPLQKHLRDIFISGSMDDVRNYFQELMTYCAVDVKATHSVFKCLWPEFLERFPHPVTFAGMLEMGLTYLPVNENWTKYITASNRKYNELENQINSVLFRLADDASRLPPDVYKKNVWLWDLDWSSKRMRIKKANAAEPEVSDKKTKQKQINKETMKSKSVYMYVPRPSWYADICERVEDIRPTKISLQRRITAKLLQLVWDGYPLHYDDTHGWGYLVPCFNCDELQEPASNNAEDFENTQTPPCFPFGSLLEVCSETKPDWAAKMNLLASQEKMADEILEKIQTFNGQQDDEDVSHYWAAFNHLRSSKSNNKNNSMVEFSGEGPFLDVVPGCEFYKLPHKDGAGNRVGNPLAKDFISKIEQGVLRSTIGSDAESVLKFGMMGSYWKNNVKRISSQMVVQLSPEDLPVKVDDNLFIGAIVPRVITAGTVTRRAVEPTWLTASNAYPDRIGSELKAMIQCPPGYHFVGADVDSQELWIAAILGDAHFHTVHGCTAFGWMTLQGTKSEGTDLHSHTAKIVGISRDQAKVFNYGRIYGAGQKFAEQLLTKFNYRLTGVEARQKARTMFLATKGRRVRVRSTTEDNIRTKWQDGSESHMFNMLEQIAQSTEPRTPVLNCMISKALEPRNVNSEFMTSRVNWVVQSSAVDYLHLMLVCMRWLLDLYHINGRFCISIHDEVRYLIASNDRYRGALALQITNLLTRSMFAYQLGFNDLPMSVAFFSSVDIDTCLRKESSMDCVTPSNPRGLKGGYNIQPGVSLDINEIIQQTGGKL